jgi:hypothetical protein
MFGMPPMILYRLRLKHGNWTEAVGRYHASDKTAQRNYICNVWEKLNRLYGLNAQQQP